MMTPEHLEVMMQRAKERRARREQRLLREIESGIVSGKILSNGAYYTCSPKGIQHWYTTRQLITRVTEIMDRNERSTGRRVCYINNKWQLQIRGKHLRRLLKAMPGTRQEGNMLIQTT